MSDDATLFDWDSGFVDDVDFTIEAASFTYNSKMGEDLVLKLTGTYKDEDGSAQELEQFYKCGAGWEPFENNTRARREDGRDKLFNAKSSIVEFINAAVGAGVTKDMVVNGGGPTSVGWMVGLTFHMNQKQFEGTFDGEKKTWFKFLPTKLIDTKKVSKAKAAPSNDHPINQPVPSDTEGVPAALKAKLKSLAKEHDNHDAFIDAAFSKYESDVSGNAAVEALVLDPDFYNGTQ